MNLQSSSVDSDRWFICPQPSQAAKTRLFLFPYAGGGPAVFSKWGREFSGDIEAWVAHYPGRGARHKEPPINSLAVLVEKFALAIQPFLDKPFVFFGHSLGGLLAFELARRLRRQNHSQPAILFISACGAPDLPDPYPPAHLLPDAEFLAAVQKFNGIPIELLQQTELMQILLPMLRADVEAVENYRYTADVPRLNIPIIAFGGLDDPRVDRERIEGWALQTVSNFSSQYFPGDHFFLNAARESIITSITAEVISFHAKK